MKSLLFFFAVSVVLLGTLFGGWQQGRMQAKRADSSLLKVAAKRLQEPLPEQLGSWRLLQDMPFTEDVRRMLQCPAHVNRSYMHQQTGDVVAVTVIVGPPGPISVHTPEICYGSNAYEILGDRAATKIVDQLGQEHSLWQVSMEPRDGVRPPQRVFYGWGTGGAWSSPRDPRISQAGEPYLYKLQLAGPPSPPDGEFKPCEDFLNCFLAEIQKRLVTTQGDSTDNAHTR